MKGLLVRMDDITPDMNWDKFGKITAILEKYHIYPLLGIVPDNQDPQLQIEDSRPDFAEEMIALQKRGYTLSQHGYQHVYESENGGMLNVHRTSEFAGLSFEIQLKKLLTGRELLQQQGICTDIFMAPGHAYDENTLKALQQTRFQYVTDGYGCTPYQQYGLRFIPCTLTRVKERKGIDTICIHANTMSEQDMEDLERDIIAHKELFLDWREVLNMPVQDKSRRIERQERKELKERERKAYMASSEIFQSYLQNSNAPNKYVKLCRRICGLPGLAIRLLGKKVKH